MSDAAISGQSVNLILRQLAKAAGIPNSDQMSAHSLTRGFAIESARAVCSCGPEKMQDIIKIIKIMVKAGAGRKLKNAQGITPLMLMLKTSKKISSELPQELQELLQDPTAPSVSCTPASASA